MAIARGLASHSEDRPGYWIHTSGQGILTYEDIKRKTWGQLSEKFYSDDDDGIGELTSFPDEAPHRKVDAIVLSTSAENRGKVNTAIVAPPTIYGAGRGPGNRTSIQVYNLASLTLEQGHGLMIGDGKNYWNNVHVHDLSNVYLALVEAAVAGGGRATWNQRGYYLTGSGEHAWGEVSRAVASECKAHGFIDTDEVVSLGAEEANALRPNSQYVYQLGGNSRGKAVRARQLLNWVPKGRGLMEEIPDIVKAEAKKSGLVPGHAKKAAGEA